MTQPDSRRLLTRRDALRILAIGGAVGVAWRLGLRSSRIQVAHRSRVLMGTEVHLQVLGDDREATQAAADATLEAMARLEALLSRYRSDSEVSRLNASGHVDDASQALLDVLQLADRIARLGDGAFDVTVQPVLDLYGRGSDARRASPSAPEIDAALERVGHHGVRIDGGDVRLTRPGMVVTLDGIGKGYVVDGGVAELRSRGFANVFVEAGGDLVAGGEREPGQPWRIGIRSPRSGLALQAQFNARDRAVATSGDYMQPFTHDFAQHHIIDPRTGRSAPELASSTVVAPNAATADALATLTMVLGARRGRELLEDLSDCEGYLVSKDLTVTRSSGFEVS